MNKKELPGGRKPYTITSNIEKQCAWCEEIIPANVSRWQYPYIGQVHNECSKTSRALILAKQPILIKKKSKNKVVSLPTYTDKKGRNTFIAPKNIRGWRDIA